MKLEEMLKLSLSPNTKEITEKQRQKIIKEFNKDDSNIVMATIIEELSELQEVLRENDRAISSGCLNGNERSCIDVLEEMADVIICKYSIIDDSSMVWQNMFLDDRLKKHAHNEHEYLNYIDLPLLKESNNFSYPYNTTDSITAGTYGPLVGKALDIIPKMIHNCCKIIRGYDINSYALLFDMSTLLKCIENICKQNGLFDQLDIMVNVKFERMRRNLEEKNCKRN